MAEKKVGTFSRGMRQRLGLAEIVMKDARIAILDEPTNGLDPQASIELLELIRSLKAHGVSILLSSHLLDRVQSVCDRVALFNAGKIALMGTVAELGRHVLGGGYTVEVEAESSDGIAKRLSALARRAQRGGAGARPLPHDLRPRPARGSRRRGGGGRRAAQAALARPAQPGSDLHPLLPAGSSKRRPAMRREGSPWQGLGVVMLKELSDHLASARMRVLEWLVVLVALAAVYAAITQVRAVTAQDPFLFLRLFTTARDPLPSFVSFLGFLVPLMAIGLGFDAINGEHNRRTLSRVLSQPIYRDALLFGKFLAGLITLAISLIVLWLLVIGLGLLMLGVPPGGAEMGRALIFLGVTIAYAGVWLALAMLFSVIFRSPATAALVTLGLWLFLTRDLAGAGAGDRARPGAVRRSGGAGDHRADAGAAVAVHALRRIGAGAAAPDHPRARAGLSQPVAGRRDGLAAAAVGQRDGGLAADRRPDRRQHPVVRRRLRRLPAAGGPSVARTVWEKAVRA